MSYLYVEIFSRGNPNFWQLHNISPVVCKTMELFKQKSVSVAFHPAENYLCLFSWFWSVGTNYADNVQKEILHWNSILVMTIIFVLSWCVFCFYVGTPLLETHMRCPGWKLKFNSAQFLCCSGWLPKSQLLSEKAATTNSVISGLWESPPLNLQNCNRQCLTCIPWGLCSWCPKVVSNHQPWRTKTNGKNLFCSREKLWNSLPDWRSVTVRFSTCRSPTFHNFIKVALTKNPKKRPNADRLLEVSSNWGRPFSTRANSRKWWSTVLIHHFHNFSTCSCKEIWRGG